MMSEFFQQHCTKRQRLWGEIEQCYDSELIVPLKWLHPPRSTRVCGNYMENAYEKQARSMIRTSRLFYISVLTGTEVWDFQRKGERKQKLSCSLIYLLQMQTHVNVKKLVPPSFYDVAVVTEGVPSVQEESVVWNC